MVYSPYGLVPKSKVYLLSKGQHLRVQNNHVYIVDDITGNLIRDLGIKTDSNGSHPILSRLPKNQTLQISQSSSNSYLPGYQALNQNWVASVGYENTSSTPISEFTTDWVVPSLPQNISDGQIFYIFPGMAEASQEDIIQPCLQWGDNGEVGSTYWIVANYYVWATGMAINNWVKVTPGEQIQASIIYNGDRTLNGYYGNSYTCQFTAGGITDSMVIEHGDGLPAINQEVWTYEVLEADKLISAADYPTDYAVRMGNIGLETGSTNPNFLWTTATSTLTTTEHAVVANNANLAPGGITSPGEVDLWFHPAPSTPLINGVSSILFDNTYNWTTAWYITATPGANVQVAMTMQTEDINPRLPAGATTGSMTFTTPGVTFSDGTTSISATQATVTKTFIMPSSGIIYGTDTWSISRPDLEPTNASVVVSTAS